MAILAWPAAGWASGMCRAESGERVVPLIELYTSEGCDSCPVADRWLSMHFPAGSRTPGVALAFHVDYWDRLGWKDRFATPAHTARQHQVMRANRSTFVYTPQLVLQGRDYPTGGESPRACDRNRGDARSASAHDHVVRAFTVRLVAAATGSFGVRVPRPVEAGAHPTLVAFVQHVANSDILQTLAVALEGCR